MMFTIRDVEPVRNQVGWCKWTLPFNAKPSHARQADFPVTVPHLLEVVQSSSQEVGRQLADGRVVRFAAG